MLEMRTTREMRVPGTDLWITPAGPMPEPHDDVWVKEIPGDTGTPSMLEITWLVQDPYFDDFEWGDPEDDPEEWVNGCFRDFRDSHDGGGQEARDAFIEAMTAKVGADNVFVVDVYSHGLDHFSVANSVNYPDRRWDVAPACVLAVPPDVTNPREWADGIMESYSSFACGDTWIVVTNRVTLDGTVVEEECIGGYIGRKYAEEEAGVAA